MDEAIIVTELDRERLLQLVDTFSAREQHHLTGFLSRELDRARIVPWDAVPPDVATMHSRVQYRDNVTGAVHTVTLVYPGDEDRYLGRLSIVSDTASALLGLSVGQTHDWRTRAGKPLSVTLLRVIYQPEAAGRGDL
ncbi:MAG: nucleoside diphosphate kinase regulator [Rhodospirillales bacterium]|nr:MAG: nucleoside diphosphate kinase regulator [Rhodospirillales bacterium]